jgi:hypothetical protein
MDLSPLHFGCSRNSTSGRIKKSPRWDDEEGVASTVGTIMALMVFLTAMGMFTNQFVPVWMSDNESAHMSMAIQQFVTLKSQIDGVIADSANSLVAPTPLFVPITLSAAGIPVFAGPTAGILAFHPKSTYMRPSFNVSFEADDYSLGPLNDGHSGGDIDLYCPNRYYVEQHVVYENGAVIINQSDGEFVIAGIQLSVSNYIAGSDTSRVVKLTQVSLMGQNKTVGGMGSKGISADVLYADTSVYNSTGGADIVITIVSKHGSAWGTFFENSLNNSLADLTYGTDFTVSRIFHDFTDYAYDYYVTTVTIMDVNVFDHTHATIQVSIGELGV